MRLPLIKRTVFFVSDQTGITAETMGHSLLTQFEGVEFRAITLPFIATVDKALEAREPWRRGVSLPSHGARPASWHRR